MSDRPKLIEIVAAAFWVFWIPGALVGALEGLQLIRVQPHIFSVFSGADLTVAVVGVSLLMATVSALAGAAGAAVVWLAGRVIAPIGSWPTAIGVVVGAAKAVAILGIVSGNLRLPLVDRLFGRVLRGPLASIEARLLVAVIAGVAAGLVAALVVAAVRRSRHAEALPGPRASMIAAAVAVAMGVPTSLFEGSDGAPSKGVDERPNILLVVVDALRSDRLGCYGYDGATSPNIDALAARSVVYDQAVVQYPATGPSFGSLFTAKYPRRHGLSAMDPRAWIGGAFNTTLAESLAAEGYATAAIMTGSITRSSGLARGFRFVFEELPSYGLHRKDSAFASMRARTALSRFVVSVRKRGDSAIVATEVCGWVSRDRQPWFAFVHLYDTHSPYSPPEQFLTPADRDYDGPFRVFSSRTLKGIASGAITMSEADRVRLDALYDAEVRAADQAVGTILEHLERTGMADNTIIILTADHGEDLLDHGVVEHGFIFNTNLLVPLLIHLPGMERTSRVCHPVELIDVAPLLLDHSGASVPSGIDGVTIPLTPAPETDSPVAFAEADCQYFGRGPRKDCWISVQTDRWKLDKNVTRGLVRLFSVVDDPLELEDLAAANPEVVGRLEPQLDAWNESQPDLEGLRRELGASGRAEIEERLRALGYLE